MDQVAQHVGAYIMGRKMFGGGDGDWDESWTGWRGENPPYHAPVSRDSLRTHRSRSGRLRNRMLTRARRGRGRSALSVAAAVTAFLAITTASAPARTDTVGHSVQGRAITAQVLGPDSAPRKILLVGCIHGNECAGGAILSSMSKRLPGIGVQLWLVQQMNPDGAAANTRQNAHGVDLNRNFPHQWQPVPGPTYYSGPHPASEPETRAAMALILRIHPAVTIWYHQHEDLVDMAGGDRGVARRYAQVSGLRPTCLPFLPGTAPAWSNHRLPGTTSFVVELPAGPVAGTALSRHRRAVQAMERGERTGSRTSCAP